MKPENGGQTCISTQQDEPTPLTYFVVVELEAHNPIGVAFVSGNALGCFDVPKLHVVILGLGLRLASEIAQEGEEVKRTVPKRRRLAATDQI